MNKAVAISIPVVAGTVICKDNNYLLVQENFEPCYGLWNLPAWKVDQWETIMQAAIRETQEETWLQVKLWKLLDTYHENATAAIKYAYEWIIIWWEVTLDPEELLDIQRFDLKQIQIMHQSWKLRNNRVYHAILQYELSIVNSQLKS